MLRKEETVLQIRRILDISEVITVISACSHGLVVKLRVVCKKLQGQGVSIGKDFRMVGHLISQFIHEDHSDFEVIIGIESLRSLGLCVKLSLEEIPFEDGCSGRNVDGETEYD